MRVENTSARQYDLSFGGKTVSIPRGQGGDDNRQNGVAEVDDALLAALENDPWLKAVFDSGDLVKKGPTRSTVAGSASAPSTAADDSKATRYAVTDDTKPAKFSK